MRWFCGAETNAAFNELDRHALAAQDKVTAFVSDSSDGQCERTTLRELLVESVLAACALGGTFGLSSSSHQRVALYLPNDARATVWIEAAKRMALPYVAIASGTASRSLTDRLLDTDASVLVTCDGLVPVATEALGRMATPAIGLLVPPSSQTVLGWHSATDALQLARERLLEVSGGQAVEILPHERLVHDLWRLAPPLPVDASFPLFVLYTLPLFPNIRFCAPSSWVHV